MRLSANSAGTQQPYFDEVGVITVTSPTGVVRIRNVIRWQSDCRDSSGTDINITGGSGCGTQPTPALDITSAFGSQCGVFTVNIRVRNSYSPYGYSTCWIVPV